MIKLRASKLTIEEVSAKEERTFLNNYHYQGYAPSSYCYGLYQDDELIELMSFSKPRYNKKADWELLRLCTKHDYQVYGGASKLFNYFISEFPNDVIISYCNRDKFSGKVYEALNFEAGVITKGYHYEKDGISYSRQKFTKQKCLKLFPDVSEELSERQIMELKGYKRIEDEVGQQVFFYYPTNKSPKWLIYKITINEYTYIGQHKYFNENDNYFGSGTVLKRCQNKYNTKGVKEILVKDITSQQEANKLEKEFINKDREENSNNINIADGGYQCEDAKPRVVNYRYNNYWNTLSEEQKQAKRVKLSKGAKEFWNTLSEEERKEFIKRRIERKDYNPSEDVKSKISNSVKEHYNTLSDEEKDNLQSKAKESQNNKRQEEIDKIHQMGFITREELMKLYNKSSAYIKEHVKPVGKLVYYNYYNKELVIYDPKENVVNQIHQMGFITREEKAAEMGLSISGFKKRHIKPKGKIGNYNYY